MLTTTLFKNLTPRLQPHSVSELELIQLLWSPEERPRFVHRATCPSLEGGPFEGSWRATKTQLDGDIVILTSHGESACLWNWREETWGFIHPGVDYSQLNVSKQPKQQVTCSLILNINLCGLTLLFHRTSFLALV